MTSALPLSTSVGTRISGSSSVMSRPMSAVTASWLAAFGHAAIISRTSST